VVVLIFAIVAASQRRRDKRKGGLGALRTLLEGAQVTPGSDQVQGAFRGIPLTFSYTTRGSGSAATAWTEITVPRRAGAPVQLSLRPQTRREERLRDEGLVIDLVLDDPPFDDAFIVEGAPTDVVRALLDDPLRAALLWLQPIELDVADGKIMLAKEGWIEEEGAIRSAVEVAVMAAERVPRAVETADAAVEKVMSGPAFRQEPDATAERAAKTARAAELADLSKVRSARAAAQMRGAWVAVVIVALITVLGLVVAILKAQAQ
jgi:hypothetical protein